MLHFARTTRKDLTWFPGLAIRAANLELTLERHVDSGLSIDRPNRDFPMFSSVVSSK